MSDLNTSSIEELIKKANNLKTVGNDPTVLDLKNAQIEYFEKSLSDEDLEEVKEDLPEGIKKRMESGEIKEDEDTEEN